MVRLGWVRLGFIDTMQKLSKKIENLAKIAKKLQKIKLRECSTAATVSATTSVCENVLGWKVTCDNCPGGIVLDPNMVFLVV